MNKLTEEQLDLADYNNESLKDKLMEKKISDIRTFETGATRDSDTDKLDFEGFLSPLVIERYAQYMHKHRKQSDGQLRESDNWQKGIPIKEYMRSAWRHFFDVWKGYRKGSVSEELICATLFNLMGMLHEILKERNIQI